MTKREPTRYAAVQWGYSYDRRPVFKTPQGWACKILGHVVRLGKSSDGLTGDEFQNLWFPLEGWTRAELRELGFTVPSDDIVPEHEQMAKAVLAGDRGAALALADWVVEHWHDADRKRIGIIEFAADASDLLRDHSLLPVNAPAAGCATGYEVTWNLRRTGQDGQA